MAENIFKDLLPEEERDFENQPKVNNEFNDLLPQENITLKNEFNNIIENDDGTVQSIRREINTGAVMDVSKHYNFSKILLEKKNYSPHILDGFLGF